MQRRRTMACKFVPCSQTQWAGDSSEIPPRVPQDSTPIRRPLGLSLRETIPTPWNTFEDAVTGFQGTATETSPPCRWPCVSEVGLPPAVTSEDGDHECESEPPLCSAAEVESAKAKAKRGQRHEEPVQVSLSSHLSEVDGVSSDRIFLVRKIQKLQLGSLEAIRAHFSTYGKVDAVLVAHSHVMSSCRRFVRRMRPSNLAIVIMASEEAVAAIHSAGGSQVIDGVSVLVEHFQRRSPMQCDEDVTEGQHSSCRSDCRDTSANGRGFVVAPSFADSEAIIGSTASSGDSDNVISNESDDDCHIPIDFEYYPTDDEGF